MSIVLTFGTEFDLDPSAAEFRRRRQPKTCRAAEKIRRAAAPAEISGRRRRRIFLGAPRR